MDTPDFSTYTDEELDAARVSLQIECERRQRLASIPNEITSLAVRYTEDGGDVADLIAALPEPPDTGSE